jgi:ribA/ribD-fused uncharacterized protein
MRVTEDYVFFYTANDYLSNFYPAKFKIREIEFLCTEQHLMFSKAKLFKDEENATNILKATKPGTMKAYGRKVVNFSNELWKQHRENILYEGNLEKFLQNESLKKELLSTYPKRLVEASPRDLIYGVGLNIDDPRINDPSNWKGLNLLGQILERVRDHIM